MTLMLPSSMLIAIFLFCHMNRSLLPYYRSLLTLNAYLRYASISRSLLPYNRSLLTLPHTSAPLDHKDWGKQRRIEEIRDVTKPTTGMPVLVGLFCHAIVLFS